jgi:hypothetical protein
LIQYFLKFSECIKVEEMESVLIDVVINDALQFWLISTSNSNGICVDSSSIVKTLYNFANVSTWVIGSTIGNVHNIDATSTSMETTRRFEHKVTDALCGATSVSVANSSISRTIVWYRANSIPSSDTSTTRVVKAVKAELHIKLVIECHHCDFDRFAKEWNQITKCSRHFIEFSLADASGGVQYKEDVLYVIRITRASI